MHFGNGQSAKKTEFVFPYLLSVFYVPSNFDGSKSSPKMDGKGAIMFGQVSPKALMV